MKHKPKHLPILFITCMIFLPGIRLLAQWSTSATVNNAICTIVDDQESPVITTDGAEGAIIAFWDRRNGDWDVYAQRVDFNGVVQWTAGGVAISTATQNQTNVQIVSDGAGGAIMAWIDTRGGNDNNIYAQRVDGSGTVLWTTNGVAICTAAFSEVYMRITADGGGGAIISWRDRRNGPTKGPTDIYAQRINAAGVVQWTTNGVAICTQAAIQDTPDLTSDGQKGAYIAWDDARGADQDIYIQHIDSSGTVLWATNGIPICTTSGQQVRPILVPDAAGGAIIVWEDRLSIGIYAQHVNSAGTTSWTTNGIAVCNGFNAKIIPDNAGGAVLTWIDIRYDPDGDIYAQHINSSGASLWTANGEAVCTELSQQFNPSIAPSGTGFIISWYDGRNPGPNGSTDIYAQRIDATGVTQWTTDGIAISIAANSQFDPVIVASTCGGGIITWYDTRDVSTLGVQIYAQRVNADGSIGPYSPLSLSITPTHIECGEPGSGAIDLTVSGGTSPYTYVWTGTGTSPATEDQSGLSAGTYIVIVTDGVGCSATDTIEIIDCEQRLAAKSTKEEKEIQTGINVSVRPNPVTAYFNIQVKSRDHVNQVSIRIFNSDGKAITGVQRISAGSTILINSDKWTAGVYYAEVVQAGKKEVIKLVKTN